MTEPIYVLEVTFTPDGLSMIADAGHDKQALRAQAVQFVITLYGYETEQNSPNGWCHPKGIRGEGTRQLAAVVCEVSPFTFDAAIKRAERRRNEREALSQGQH